MLSKISTTYFCPLLQHNTVPKFQSFIKISSFYWLVTLFEYKIFQNLGQVHEFTYIPVLTNKKLLAHFTLDKTGVVDIDDVDIGLSERE